MKPLKIFLFFLIILIIIGLAAYIYPDKGIRIGEEYALTFPSLTDMLQKEETNYKDISKIVQNNPPSDTTLNFIPTQPKDSVKPDSLKPDRTDTSSKQKNKKEPRTTYKRKNDVNTLIQLEYPNDSLEILHPFFNSAQNASAQNELIRILHYGDSQIEGDRISSYIRNQLQKKFGGSGIGLFPAIPPFNTSMSVKHKASGNWDRYTLMDSKDANYKHKRYGTLMSFSRYSPTYSNYQDKVYEAYITIKESPIAFERAASFQTCRVFYGHNEKPFIVKLKEKNQISDADMIPPTSKLKTIKWDIAPSTEELSITFQGTHSPEIYGITLDGKKGIALDNIPLRGSSGTGFTKTDRSFYKSMFDQLNVKLIILYFGVNVVPNVKENYRFYKNSLYQQLKFLKSLEDQLSIIVMGVSDMSRKVEGHYESYPNIEKIRAAQKQAAFRANCVFWDTYKAMGGNNSMPSWVFSDPPLARKDFTHFTYKGSVVIAKMFYKALMNDYNKYLQQTNQEMLSSKPQHK